MIQIRRGRSISHTRALPPPPRVVAVAATVALLLGSVSVMNPVASAAPLDVLNQIVIQNADDIRGNVHLPLTVDGAAITWTSSNDDIVTDTADGQIAAGVVTRPAAGSPAAAVTLTACTTVDSQTGCRDINVTIRPSIPDMAEFTGYGMFSFRGRSEKFYTASSVGNDALTWEEINGGAAVFESIYGTTGLRDPSIVRSPEGDKFFLVGTDLMTRAANFNQIGGWNWAQTGGNSYIEVWESNDLINWSEQRHVRVNTSEETGMTFAPEAIWDPELGAYLVYWTSAIYPPGTYYSRDRTDPNAREGSWDQSKWGRNVTYYTVTRDFVNFSPSQVMYDRGGPDGIGTGTWITGYGNLDPQITYNPDDGYYYRTVQDRWDKVFDYLYPECYTPEQQYTNRTDLYIERSTSILAPAEEWELLGGCLTVDAVNTSGVGSVRYQEGPQTLKTNPGDVNGDGWYMFADGGLTLADGTSRPGLNPYFTTNIAGGAFDLAMDWLPPSFDGAAPQATHGHTFAVTAAEHAAFRGADLLSLAIDQAPTKTEYAAGEELDLAGMLLSATYSDDKPGIEIKEGFGGYTVTGFDSSDAGLQTVTVSFTVGDTTKTATFEVRVAGGDATALKALLDTANGVDANLYTEESYAALADQITAAQAVYDDRDNMTQDELDAAAAELQQALTGLVTKPDVVVPNKDALQEAQDNAMALSNVDGTYTADSWAVLQQEIADAAVVLNDDAATQEQIDSALAELTAAVAGLVMVDKSGGTQIDTGGQAVGQSPAPMLLAVTMLLAAVAPITLRWAKR